MSQHIENAVITAIEKQKNLDRSHISLDSVLADLGVSSLDAISIVYEIEEAFDIEVPNEALEGLGTVRDIVDGIARLIAEKA